MSDFQRAVNEIQRDAEEKGQVLFVKSVAVNGEEFYYGSVYDGSGVLATCWPNLPEQYDAEAREAML